MVREWFIWMMEILSYVRNIHFYHNLRFSLEKVISQSKSYLVIKTFYMLVVCPLAAIAFVGYN